MLMLKNTYVGWNYLTLITILATATMFMLILATILREENMLMISMIISMILSMLQKLQSCTLLVVMLWILLLILATIMKEEVIRALFVLLIIMSYNHLLKVCIILLLLVVIHSYIKCQCIERMLDFVVTWSILYGVFFYASTC